MPAACQVDVLAVVAAARVVEVACRVHVRNGHATALRVMIADGFRQCAPPRVGTDEERRTALAPRGDLIKAFAVEVAEIAGQTIRDITLGGFQRPRDREWLGIAAQIPQCERLGRVLVRARAVDHRLPRLRQEADLAHYDGRLILRNRILDCFAARGTRLGRGGSRGCTSSAE